MISADVYPPSALHHAGPLQDVVVGLPLHLMLEGTHLTLRFSICQISCGVEDTDEKQHLGGGGAHPVSLITSKLVKDGGLLYLLQALEPA